MNGDDDLSLTYCRSPLGVDRVMMFRNANSGLALSPCARVLWCVPPACVCVYVDPPLLACACVRAWACVGRLVRPSVRPSVRARALVCFVLRNEGRGRDEEVRKLKGYASDGNITGEIEGNEFRFCNIQFS